MTFVEVPAPTASDAIEIVARSTVRVCVRPGFDEAMLRRLLGVLERLTANEVSPTKTTTNVGMHPSRNGATRNLFEPGVRGTVSRRTRENSFGNVTLSRQVTRAHTP